MSVRPALAAAVTAAGVILLVPTASAVGRYTDPAGDGGAADATGVTVASDPTGQIVFTVHLVDFPAGANLGLVLFLDTDLNVTTGMPGSFGTDYVFIADRSDGTWDFARWTGSDLDWDTPYSTVTVQMSRTAVLISVNRSELGGTGGFNFGVRTVAFDESGWQEEDTAPDLGRWNYSLPAGGPEIRGVTVSTSPSAGPKAGRPFIVKPVGVRTPSTGQVALPQPESYSCRATLGGKRLPGAGQGGCTFKLPPSARGKMLRLRVGVGYQGSTKSLQLAYRVS